MEVSSHGLDQGRVNGVAFDCALFTNLTHDHLDYHGTLDAYAEAKARLFSWPGLNRSIVNIDDAFGASLARADRDPARLIVTARQSGSQALQRELAARGAGWLRAERLTIHGRGMTLAIDSAL